MPKQKFYAVKKGKTTGIFTAWSECQASVSGYPGAEFKSFPTREEADAWLCGSMMQSPAFKSPSASPSSSTQQNVEIRPADLQKANVSQSLLSTDQDPGTASSDSAGASDALTAYVDGSFREDLSRYAYGCVFLLPDGRILRLSGCFDDPDGVQIRNVAGEMRGASSAVNFALQNGFQNLKIYYDYQGIECWATGSWKAGNPLTARYAAYMQSQGRSVGITFHKVAAHTGDTWNEEADRLAKSALTGEPGLPNILLPSDAQ